MPSFLRRFEHRAFSAVVSSICGNIRPSVQSVYVAVHSNSHYSPLLARKRPWVNNTGIHGHNIRCFSTSGESGKGTDGKIAEEKKNEGETATLKDKDTETSVKATETKESTTEPLPAIDESERQENARLFAENQGFLSRLWKTTELLKPDVKERFVDYAEQGVLPKDKFVIASNLFVDLEHPLITKYRFDPKDFVEGAHYASQEIRQAVSVMEIKDESKRVQSLDLLKIAMSSPLYTLYSKAFELMDRPGDETVLGGITMSRFTMIGVNPVIVDDAFYKEEEKRYRRLSDLLVDFLFRSPEGSASSAPGAGGAKPAEEILQQVTDLELWLDQAISVPRVYPAGSVLAKVDVTFDTEEETISRDHGQETKNMQLRNTFMTFEACISGQVPMDWIVTHMDTVAKKNKSA